MKLHHIGLVVESINRFEENMIYEEKTTEIFDPLQHATLALYKNFGDSHIELIEPLSEKALTWNFLKTKTGPPVHHFCYEIEDLATMTRIREKLRLIPVLDPIPAKLFRDKHVAFYYTRNKMIVEFLINHM